MASMAGKPVQSAVRWRRIPPIPALRAGRVCDRPGQTARLPAAFASGDGRRTQVFHRDHPRVLQHQQPEEKAANRPGRVGDSGNAGNFFPAPWNKASKISSAPGPLIWLKDPFSTAPSQCSVRRNLSVRGVSFTARDVSSHLTKRNKSGHSVPGPASTAGGGMSLKCPVRRTPPIFESPPFAPAAAGRSAATEGQQNANQRPLFVRRDDDQWIKPAGQRLGLRAEFCMDAASARRSRKTHAPSLWCPIGSGRLGRRSSGRIQRHRPGPALLFDALFVFRQKLDEQVIAAAVRCNRGSSILNRRNFNAQ